MVGLRHPPANGDDEPDRAVSTRSHPGPRGETWVAAVHHNSGLTALRASGADGAEQTAGSPRLSPGDLAMTALGLAARIWMRAISPEPELSWAGTTIIVGLAAWLGIGTGWQ